MKNIRRLAIGLLIPIALYSCSGDEEEDNTDGTGGEQSKGGSSNGTKATGGKSSTGTSSVKPSTGGTFNNTGGATSKGGAAQTGGVTAAAGQSSVSLAGSSAVVSVGGASTGGVQNAAGATAGVAGAGLAGASSAAPQSCDALCGTATSCKPECMEKVFGYSSNTAVPLCLPRTTLLGGAVTLCAKSNCGANQPGCAITAVLGTSDWKYTPAASRNTKVRLETTIKSVTGTIDMSVPNLIDCTLTPVLPSAGMALAANGTVAPRTANPSLLGVTVHDIVVDLTQLTFSSADQTCATAASGFASNTEALTQELLAVLQQRAAELSCLECDGRCPQNIACTAP